MDELEGRELREEELRFLAQSGMSEVEPGRWMSDWSSSDPESQEWLDSLGDAGREHLDLLARAGRVTNEFDMERTGAPSAVTVQRITNGPLDVHGSQMAVFVAIKNSSVELFESLDGEQIQDKLDEVMEKYEDMLPPDLTAVALRGLGVKCKTVLANPEHTGPEGPDVPPDPRFRLAVMHFPGANRTWLSSR